MANKNLKREIEDKWNIKSDIIEIPDGPRINIHISHEEIKDVSILLNSKEDK